MSRLLRLGHWPIGRATFRPRRILLPVGILGIVFAGPAARFVLWVSHPLMGALTAAIVFCALGAASMFTWAWCDGREARRKRRATGR